jgi:hypothetical protein
MNDDHNCLILEALLRDGWVETDIDPVTPERHAVAVIATARALGTVTAVRGLHAIETLRPRTRPQARQGCMSAVFGCGVQPWHMDMAHRPSPARFILLSCMDPGERPCATELLNWRQLLSSEQLTLSSEAPVLVRSGRASFYTTMLDGQQRFLRHDPTCITALTDEGRALQAQIAAASERVHAAHWQAGRTLIFDNWRFLHRRSDASHSPSRALLRITIME